VGTFKISGYLFLKRFEKVFIELDTWHSMLDTRYSIHRRQVLEQLGFDLLGLGQRQTSSAKGVSGTGKAKVAPSRLENYIFYRFLHFFAYNCVLKYY